MQYLGIYLALGAILLSAGGILAAIISVIFGFLVGSKKDGIFSYGVFYWEFFLINRAIKRKINSFTQTLVSSLKGDGIHLYQKINSNAREFRLLRILPKDTSNLIKTKLVLACLDDESLRYEALSYTWGGSLRLHQILLEGKPYLITKNLATALAHLQLLDADRLIWIDALCIDQSSSTERSEQVTLMRDIYLNARNGVVVWLGDSSLASTFLRQAERHENPQAWFRSTIGSDLYKKKWIAVQEILSRDYWRRVWIIQEIACASSISVLCGNDRLDWNMLVAVDSVRIDGALFKKDGSPWFLRQGIDLWLDEKIDALLRTIISSENRFEPPHDDFIGPKHLAATRALNQSSDLLSLFDLMCIHYASNATDPRDKFYALVGIAAASNDEKLSINYSLSERSVMMQASEFMLNSAKTLDLICFGLPCLPPFIPSRLSVINTRRLLHSMGTGLAPSSGSLLSKYTAAGNSRPVAQLFIYPKFVPERLKILFKSSMLVEGFSVDTLAGFLSEFSEDTTAFEPWIACLKAIPILKHNERALIWVSTVSLLAAKFTLSCLLQLTFILSYLWRFILYPVQLLLLPFIPSISTKPAPFKSPIWLGLVIRFLHRPYKNTYTPISILALPSTDSTFPPYTHGSSDWLGNTNHITLIDRLKHDLVLTMNTSTTNQDGSCTTRAERLDSFWRAVIGNRTADGAIPAPEFVDMFNVLLNGPDFVPPNFMILGHSNPSTEASRAQAYVRPFLEALSVSLLDRRLFISTRGMLGLVDKRAKKGDMVCVFFGCSFPVVVRARKEKGREEGDVEVKGSMCGSAYLSGYMDGRAIEEGSEGKLLKCSFRLNSSTSL